MKTKWYMQLSAAALIALTGCASKDGGNSKIANEYEQYKKSPPPAVWQPTGVRSLDDIGLLSAKLYSETYKYLQEYISATENNRYYVGLMNEVSRIKKEEQLDDVQALQKALYNISENDKQLLADGKEANLPKAIEGYNAVQALKPTNKLAAFAQMLPQIADLIARSKNISDEIKHELSNDPFKAALTMKSAANVLQQLYHTQKLANYLMIQYQRNQHMKTYMQDKK